MKVGLLNSLHSSPSCASWSLERRGALYTDVCRGLTTHQPRARLAVEYIQKGRFFALSEVSVLKLSKTVTEYGFITKYSTKLIMNGTKFIMFLKVIFPW